jgi:hypothetical protein
MTFSQSDLPHIKWSLLILLLTVGIGGSAVFIAQKYANSALADRRAAQQQLIDARNKLNAARDDQINMSTYTKEYSAIQRREIIGDEQRLNIIEGLEALRKRNSVVDFKYAIAPQQPYKPAPALDSGNFDLQLSPMTLQFELLHEGQLINFFERLHRDMNGWFILEKCTLERSAGSAQNDISSAQLKADCTGGWLTMKNRNGT